jgi:hypothetical protein
MPQATPWRIIKFRREDEIIDITDEDVVDEVLSPMRPQIRPIFAGEDPEFQ